MAPLFYAPSPPQTNDYQELRGRDGKQLRGRRVGGGCLYQRDYAGGNTALVVYTLLHVGQSLKDQRFTAKSKELQKAIGIVRKIGNTDQVYLKAIQVMALSEMKGGAEENRALRAAGRPLLAGMAPEGGYLYKFSEKPQIVKNKEWDTSSTQMSLLAAWGMLEAKVEIPTAYWAAQDKYWRIHQNSDGGWGYQEKHKQSLPSLSAAGVASLFVLNDQLRNSVGLTAVPDKQLDKGLEWLDKNVDPGGLATVPWPTPSGIFTLFSIERVALASGRKYIGGKDWYREGAASMMKQQTKDGRFQEKYYFFD